MMSSYNSDITQTTMIVCIVFTAIFGALMLVNGIAYAGLWIHADLHHEDMKPRYAILLHCTLIFAVLFYCFITRIFFSDRGYGFMLCTLLCVGNGIANLIYPNKVSLICIWLGLFGMIYCHTVTVFPFG